MGVGWVAGDPVTVGTHLDGRNVASVRLVLNAALESGEGDVVIDMRGVDLIDSAGLGMLTAAHLRAGRLGRRLVLRNCSAEMRRVFAVTHLSRVFTIDKSLELSA